MKEDINIDKPEKCNLIHFLNTDTFSSLINVLNTDEEAAKELRKLYQPELKWWLLPANNNENKYRNMCCYFYIKGS